MMSYSLLLNFCCKKAEYTIVLSQWGIFLEFHLFKALTLGGVKMYLDDAYNMFNKSWEATAGLKAEGLRNIR